MTHTTGAKV